MDLKHIYQYGYLKTLFEIFLCKRLHTVMLTGIKQAKLVGSVSLYALCVEYGSNYLYQIDHRELVGVVRQVGIR